LSTTSPRPRAKAIEEGRDHILFYFKNLAAHERPDEFAARLPAGRSAAPAFWRPASSQSSEITWEALTSVYRTVLGTPDQVAERNRPSGASRPKQRIVVHLHHRRHAPLEGGQETSPCSPKR